jgi:hypothetical protein
MKNAKILILYTDSVMVMQGQWLKGIGVGFPTITTQLQQYSAAYTSSCKTWDHSSHVPGSLVYNNVFMTKKR